MKRTKNRIGAGRLTNKNVRKGSHFKALAIASSRAVTFLVILDELIVSNTMETCSKAYFKKQSYPFV